MTSEIDLNIDNYDLKDLINLFNISYSISEEELKKAKKMVLTMHPDKSKLDKKYFLFFSSAYKILFNIYLFRNKGNINKSNRELNTLQEADKKIIDKYLNNINSKDFNKWFNTLFENTQLKDEFTENGYGNWFSSNEDIDDYSNLSNTQQSINIQKKKENLKKIIKYNDEDNNYCLENSIFLDKPENYSSQLFSKLNYEDLKKAHIETLIPITNDDINNLKNLSLEQLKHKRSQTINPISMEQANYFLKQKEEQQNIINTKRTYNLIKQDELHRKQNDLWWSNLKMITR